MFFELIVHTRQFTLKSCRGPATRYNFSTEITQGSLWSLLNGIWSFILPMNPDFTSRGNPSLLRASFFKGRFSSSTAPVRKRGQYCETETEVRRQYCVNDHQKKGNTVQINYKKKAKKEQTIISVNYYNSGTTPTSLVLFMVFIYLVFIMRTVSFIFRTRIKKVKSLINAVCSKDVFQGICMTNMKTAPWKDQMLPARLVCRQTYRQTNKTRQTYRQTKRNCWQT